MLCSSSCFRCNCSWMWFCVELIAVGSSWCCWYCCCSSGRWMDKIGRRCPWVPTEWIACLLILTWYGRTTAAGAGELVENTGCIGMAATYDCEHTGTIICDVEWMGTICWWQIFHTKNLIIALITNNNSNIQYTVDCLTVTYWLYLRCCIWNVVLADSMNRPKGLHDFVDSFWNTQAYENTSIDSNFQIRLAKCYRGDLLFFDVEDGELFSIYLSSLLFSNSSKPLWWWLLL